jgi:ureidoacrylate peracid hydrolase
MVYNAQTTPSPGNDKGVRCLSYPTSRNIPLVRDQSALLFIDVQNFAIHRNSREYAHLSEDDFTEQYGWLFTQFYAHTLPNMQALQQACRRAGVEVMYTTIESLTRDGRDRSLDYKITGFNVPKGAWDGKVIDELAPLDDEIVLPKSSSSVFVSTHIDYILRNVGVKQLVISGLVTDQCVESAIRDACDLGYLVTQVTDACLSYSAERHVNSLQAISGYCRQITTAELIAELQPPYDTQRSP